MKKEDEAALLEMRREIFLTACAGGSAHLASAFSAAEIFYAFYEKGILQFDPADPWAEDRDRLILSKGHGSLALYAALRRRGILSEEQLRGFLKPGSLLGGEPCRNGLPGIEATTGSLGHGLSLGVGLAIAGKLDQKNGQVYVVLGDGECEEGSVWEAVMAAYKYRLGNLTAVLDCNRIQKMGFLADTMRISSWRGRWEAFGWQVDEIPDGHDVDQICACLGRAHPEDTPRLVIAHTVKGKGVSLMENNPDWHFKLPNRRERKVFLRELQIPEEEFAARTGIRQA